MKPLAFGIGTALALAVGLLAEKGNYPPPRPQTSQNSIPHAVGRGAAWLASVQGRDGGWGQDGGETSYIRNGERMESNGNDLANTAVATLALLRAGNQYRPHIERALNFILQRVEASPLDGLSITSINGTQIQRKLGPYIDTFLTARVLSEVDGTLSQAMNARVRRGLEKCVAKIERSQQADGSWNISGGWAPVIGTSLASRSLFDAKEKGVKVEARTLARADDYTVKAMKPSADAGRTRGGRIAAAAPAESAGVALYQSAQALEQLSRTEGDRRKNAPQIAAIRDQMKDAEFMNGFGSVGGEEFFSYLNLSDGLKRAGGNEWNQWKTQMTTKILALQNEDGTWAGHHCITGRVAVTSAAILNLAVANAN